MSRRRPAPLLPALALPAFFLLLARPAAGTLAEEAFQLEAGESMPLALRLDQRILAEDLAAIAAGGRYFLPLGELCRLLDLAIYVDAGRGLAAGFLIDEKRLFALDLKFRRVEIAGERLTFDGAAVRQEPDDLYVDGELLAKWLPLDLEVDLHQLALKVTPREKLPLQLRLERERKLASGGAAAAELPRQELPYRLFDGPLVDGTLRYSRRGDFARGAGSLAPEKSDGLEYSLLATGDLLFLEASLFLHGDQGGLLESRLSLGRRDPEGRLLGVLAAREVMLGEVFHPGLELVALPRSGPGFLLSTFPLGQPSQFGRESFRGELPPGWEAELYRGDELLAYVRSRPDGLYELLDVPLLFGLNLFRIEFYGPQGQRRTERRLLNVDDSLTPPGELYYRLAGNDPGGRLVGEARGELGPRVSLELGAGISKHVSATFGVASVEHRRRRASYAQAGLRAFHGPLVASLDLALDESGGRAFKGELQSRWRGLGLRLEHAELDGFDSETLTAAGGPLRRRSWLRLDTALRGPRLPSIPLSFDLRQDQLADGRRVTEISGRFSAYAPRGLAISHQLQVSRTSGAGAPPRLATGQLLVSKQLPALGFRGAADYQVEPRFELVTLAATAELRRPGGLLLSGGVSRLFLARENLYQVGVSKLEGRIGATVTADYAASRGLGIGVLLAASLGRDSRDGSWHQQARPLAFGGSLSGRAFLDDNGNGRFDPGEQPIGGAGLLLGGASHGQRSGPEGTLFLANLAPYQPVSVALAANTLEDPYWQPARSGVTLTPRPGKVAIVDFPVEVTGELSGTVYLRLPGGRRPAAGIEVELIDAAGKVIARVRSAADGFYYLDRLRPGRFTLRIAAADVGRRRLAPPPDRQIRLAASGSLLENLDFELGQLDPAAG